MREGRHGLRRRADTRAALRPEERLRRDVRRTIAYLRALEDGRPTDVAESLTTFYRETHEANLRALPAAS